MSNQAPVYATYTPSPVSEYGGNPLIEALPPILSEQDAAFLIGHFPDGSEQERSLPKEVRLHCIDRLRTVVQPLEIHLELESAVSARVRPNPTRSCRTGSHSRRRCRSRGPA